MALRGPARTRAFSPADHFPLGHSPLRQSPLAHRPVPSPPEASRRPFGLRFVSTPARQSLDLATVSYDADQQIGVVERDGEWTPLPVVNSPMTVESTGEVGRPTYDEIHDYDHDPR